MTRARRHINISFLLAVIALLSPSFLLSSCSSGDDGMNEPTPQDEKQEIRFNPGVWNFMEGTRAAFYDTGTPLTSSFTCTVYNASTTTPYVNQTTVNYIADQWTFESGKHYWPASGSLDFFAYMPATAPTYISGLTYAVRAPYFNCSLPMTSDGNTLTNTGDQDDLQEFVCDIKTNQSKDGQGVSGVNLDFKHPFTRINLQLSASQAKAVTINTITFKSLKSGGTCTLDGTDLNADSHFTWSSLTPAESTTDFVLTLNQAYSVTGSVQNIGIPFIMIPQEWTGEIEVNASWNDWGDTPVPHTVTTTIPAITWAAGTSYTYTFTISPDDLTVNTTNYTEQW